MTSADYIQCNDGAAVKLFYNGGTAKFETTSYGALFTDNVKFDNPDSAGRDLTWEADNDALHWEDNTKATFGAGNDLQIYHNGSHSYIADEGSGELIISGSRIQLMNAARGEKAIDFVQNGAVDIYYNGLKKFNTKSDGVDISGELSSDSLKVYSGNTGTVDVADFYTSNNGSGGSNCRLKVRTYPNAGGDPFIFFDGGGTNFVVGEQWNGTTNNKLRLGAGNDMSSVTGIDITTGGDILPTAHNTMDLGSSSLRWRNIYTADLNCSNKGSANDVDGTWGDYTIQEGENDLFLINRRNGKKFKFMLQEVQ